MTLVKQDPGWPWGLTQVKRLVSYTLWLNNSRTTRYCVYAIVPVGPPNRLPLPVRLAADAGRARPFYKAVTPICRPVRWRAFCPKCD